MDASEWHTYTDLVNYLSGQAITNTEHRASWAR